MKNRGPTHPVKRLPLLLLFLPSIVALTVLAASCSDKSDTASPVKAGSKYYQGKDSGSPEAGVPDVVLPPGMGLDAAAIQDLQKQVKTIPEAVQVILTYYDIDETEANLGKTYGNTPPLQAYSNDLLQNVKQSRARLKALYDAKDITPRSTNLSGQMKFLAQAAEMNLTGIFRNMFNSSYAQRRVQAEGNFLQTIEEQLQPVMETDDDFKAELSKVHDEAAARQSRASDLQQGVANGTAGGMFEDTDPPVAPPATQPAPKPAAGDAGN